MSRFQTEPHPLLRPYIQSYWGLVRDLSQMQRFTVTPDCFLELIFFVDPPLVETRDGLQRLSSCSLIPLLSESLRLVNEGVVRCAAVRFHAWAAGIIFPEANESRQAWYDSSASFADLIPSVTGALHRAAWAEITAIFDTTLLQRLANAQPGGPTLEAVRTFVSAPTGTAAASTQATAARHGLCRRQIERQVRQLTNRSPKQLVCLTRFHFVRDTLWARPDTELDSLALEAGYADQAHLSRHFRRYAAQTISEFKHDCARLKAFLGTEDVAFVQDAVHGHGYAREQ